MAAPHPIGICTLADRVKPPPSVVSSDACLYFERWVANFAP